MNAQPLTPIIPATKNEVAIFFGNQKIRWGDSKYLASVMKQLASTIPDNITAALLAAWKKTH
jgi:hypothetical protein